MTKSAVVSDRPTHRDSGVLTILIAEAHPLIRDGLASVLEGLAPRVDVIQTDSLQGVLASLAARPDTALVLLDLFAADGLDTLAIERVRAAHPEIPVVVVSGATDSATVAAAIRGGATGFISNRSTPQVLLGALSLALAGDVYIQPDVLRTQLEPECDESEGATQRAVAAAHDATEVDLTKRQLEVLALLVQGKPNKVISRELGLAQGTVKAHTAAIFRALGVSNRTEAAFAVNFLGIEFPAFAAPRRVERESLEPRRLFAPA